MQVAAIDVTDAIMHRGVESSHSDCLVIARISVSLFMMNADHNLVWFCIFGLHVGLAWSIGTLGILCARLVHTIGCGTVPCAPASAAGVCNILVRAPSLTYSSCCWGLEPQSCFSV